MYAGYPHWEAWMLDSNNFPLNSLCCRWFTGDYEDRIWPSYIPERGSDGMAVIMANVAKEYREKWRAG
jgi:hypothetical protein